MTQAGSTGASTKLPADHSPRARLGKLLIVAGVLLGIAACLALGALPQILTGEDARYSLLWGADIFRLESPQLDGPVPALHPLLLGVGVLLAPLGAGAAKFIFDGLAVATFLLLGYAAYRFTRALGGALLGGLLAALVVLSRPETIEQLLNTNKDILFTALVLLAGTVAVSRRTEQPIPVLALLAIAGLIRPEAWILLGAFWLRLLWDDRHLALSPIVVVLAIAAPMTWVATDLILTGDPLHTLHHGQEKSAAIEAAGLDGPRLISNDERSKDERLFDGLDFGIAEQIGWGVIAGALLVFAVGLRRARAAPPDPDEAVSARSGLLHRPLVVPLVLVVGTVLGAALVVAAGLALPGRFLLLASYVLICVAASAIRPGAMPTWLAPAALLLLLGGTLAIAPHTRDEYQRISSQRESTAEQADRLIELTSMPALSEVVESCPLSHFAGTNLARVSLGRGIAALELNIGVGALTPGPGEVPETDASALSWGRPDGSRTADTELRVGNWFFVSDC